jgi:hypothetical protein
MDSIEWIAGATHRAESVSLRTTYSESPKKANRETIAALSIFDKRPRDHGFVGMKLQGL